MNKKAIVVVEKFAEWFVPQMGIELVPSEGIRARWEIKTILGENVGELEFGSLYRDNNKLSMDMKSWSKIFQNYLEHKGVAGYLISISNGESYYCGFQAVVEIGGVDFNRDGIYFLEDK